MVASTNLFGSFIPQSKNNFSKTTQLSNKNTNENQFVKKMEKSSNNLIIDKSYKIDLASDKLPKIFSILHEGASEKKESEKTGITSLERTETETAGKSKTIISKRTINSAMKLYTIIKADILIENHHKFKTGPVDFYV